MKNWTRWEDWVAIAAGLAVVLSTMFVTHAGASLAMMLVLGILLIASGIVNLAMPGLVRPIGIIHRRGRRLTPVVARFIEELQKPGDGAA